MIRWGIQTNDSHALIRAESFLAKIARNASKEGWFLEYSGADPGYQTWAIASLALISHEAPELSNSKLLHSGMNFLAPFALSNGSFANGAGSRLTSFLMTIGPELLISTNSAAAFLASFARSNIAHRRFVSLDAVDEPNIAPFFNDVVRSAELFDMTPQIKSSFRQASENDFHEGGLFVRHYESHSIVVSSVRGGLACIAENGKPTQIRPEPVFRDSRTRLCIARVAREIEIHEDSIRLKCDIRHFRSRSQSPIKLLSLRLFMLTIGRWRKPRELVKRLLARYLLTRQEELVGTLERIVDTRTGEITDQIHSKGILSETELSGSPYHMASYGYWRY
jgi:hypothetical protein